MASAKFTKAQASGKIRIRRRPNITGEVQLHFNDPSIENLVINHNQVVDLLKLPGVDVKAILRSNIQELLNGQVEIVL